jgi:hypothetical protein
LEYTISQHASEQMTKRVISKTIVNNVLNQPDQIIRKANYTIYQSILKENAKRYLYRVFVNTNKKPNVVITIYKTSKTDKYYED